MLKSSGKLEARCRTFPLLRHITPGAQIWDFVFVRNLPAPARSTSRASICGERTTTPPHGNPRQPLPAGPSASSKCTRAMSSSLVTWPRFYLRLEKELNGFHAPLQPVLPAVGAKGSSEVSLGKSRGASYYSAGSASPASLQGSASAGTIRYFYLDGNSTKYVRMRC